MSAIDRLEKLFAVLRSEVSTNAEFAARIEEALGTPRDAVENRAKTQSAATSLTETPPKTIEKPKAVSRSRRAPAIVSAVEIAAKHGEAALRTALVPLTLDQLKDVVAEFALDPSKSATNWKSVPKFIELIVERAVARARKGDVFT